jgi:hypothetical protein
VRNNHKKTGHLSGGRFWFDIRNEDTQNTSKDAVKTTQEEIVSYHDSTPNTVPTPERIEKVSQKILTVLELVRFGFHNLFLF